MTKTNISNSINDGDFTTNRVIKINEENNVKLLSIQQWCYRNNHKLPAHWSDDYSYIADRNYYQYLLDNQISIEQYYFDTLLNDVDAKQNVSFSKILITLQKTPMKANIQLILKTNEGDEVALCSLKDVEQQLNLSLHFKNQQVDFANALNERIPDFCLPQRQQLILRVTGGFTLKANIIISSQRV